MLYYITCSHSTRTGKKLTNDLTEHQIWKDLITLTDLEIS
jgi:hypothetical protein